jgi:glycerol-3-phosphate dehydrogenase (NAD(P)+)
MKICILGAGAMGAALTVPFTDRGHNVALWCTEFDEEVHWALTGGRPHPELEISLPDSIRIYPAECLEEALSDAGLIILGVATSGVLPVIRQAAPYMETAASILTVAKGFVSHHGTPEPVPSGVRRELQALGKDAGPVVMGLAGPSIAGELVRRRPTAAAVAAESHQRSADLCRQLATSCFWLDSIKDSHGLEICLAYKNIYSIALAWPEGLSRNEDPSSSLNLSAILLLQAVHELRTLITSCRGNPDTANGWPGLGDLVATAGGGRNGRFGRLLAEQTSADKASAIMKDEGVDTIEGRQTASSGEAYAIHTFGPDWPSHLPLLHAIRNVLDDRESVRDAIGRINQFQRIRGRTNTRN